MALQGFLAFVLRPADFGDCTNGGPSSQRTKAIIVDDAVKCAQFEVDPERNFPVRIVRRDIGGREYVHAEPFYCEEWPNERFRDRWTMMGGNFLYSSDSRFRDAFGGPIPIHDRVED